MSCSGLQVMDPVCAVVGSIGKLGSSVTNSVFASMATAFGNTADSAINWLWSQMSSATAISLGGPTFELDLGIVSAIAAVVCVGLFVGQLAISALRHDGSGIGRALRGLVIATVGVAITLASLDVLLAAVDQLCAGVVRVATGDSIATLGSKIIDPALFTGLVAGPAAILILSLLAILAVAVVWFALVIRKMLIIITAIFAPLAFVGGVADLSRGWVRKWLEAMAALVFAKLILIIIFVIGLGVLGGMGTSSSAGGMSGITSDITGLLILLVAGLSPWMALKLVHFTGEHMANLAGSAAHATSGAATVIGAPQKVASMKWAAQSLGGAPHRIAAPMGVGAPLGATSEASTGPSGATGAGPGATDAPGAGAGIVSGAALVAGAATRAGRRAGEPVTRSVDHRSDVASPVVDGAMSPPSTSPEASGERRAPRAEPVPTTGDSVSSPAAPSHVAAPTRSHPSPSSEVAPPPRTSTIEPAPTKPSLASSVPPRRFTSPEPRPKEIS